MPVLGSDRSGVRGVPNRIDILGIPGQLIDDAQHRSQVINRVVPPMLFLIAADQVSSNSAGFRPRKFRPTL
ncbi:hypothetical protein [Nocardia sp. NPDC060255]|uniref:hypothetical protein n=1 Tax=Nocardia sp. NPDC060255 TaxID=3347085 RepID=UPI0036601EAC